ncbi:MAG: hypothetical protein K2X70_15995 [Candidatus Obscuribacterales bacterium]|nr:hypothetical protein [Candidatus Obscuribacterales bacterium]
MAGKQYQEKSHTRCILLATLFLCISNQNPAFSNSPTSASPTTASPASASPTSVSPTDTNPTKDTSATPTPIPGTHVQLIAPAGYGPTGGRFTGLINKKNGASIMITELPAPFSQTQAGFTKEKLAERKLDLLSSKPMSVQGMMGLYAELEQAAYETNFQKYLLHFGNETISISVLGTIEKLANDKDKEALKAAVLSATYNKKASAPSLVDGLPFTISDTTKLKRWHRLQNSLIFREQPFDEKAIHRPVYVVAPSIASLDISDKKAYAENRVSQTVHVINQKSESTKPVEIAGLKGYEIVVTGQDHKDQSPMMLYQTMLFGKKIYYIFQGICSEKDRAVYLNEFRMLTESFKPKPED